MSSKNGEKILRDSQNMKDNQKLFKHLKKKIKNLVLLISWYERRSSTPLVWILIVEFSHIFSILQSRMYFNYICLLKLYNEQMSCHKLNYWRLDVFPTKILQTNSSSPGRIIKGNINISQCLTALWPSFNSSKAITRNYLFFMLNKTRVLYKRGCGYKF